MAYDQMHEYIKDAIADKECYRAGVVAGDASGASARKLAALLAAVEQAIDGLGDNAELFAASVRIRDAQRYLRKAIAEAREP